MSAHRSGCVCPWLAVCTHCSQDKFWVWVTKLNVTSNFYHLFSFFNHWLISICVKFSRGCMVRALCVHWPDPVKVAIIQCFTLALWRVQSITLFSLWNNFKSTSSPAPSKAFNINQMSWKTASLVYMLPKIMNLFSAPVWLQDVVSVVVFL